MVTVAVLAQASRLRIHNYTIRDGLASNVVNCGLQDRQGYIWLGTSHGLTRFDGHRFANFYVEEDGDRQIEGITSMVEDTTRNVLLMSGRDHRLLCFDLGQMHFVESTNMKYPQQNDLEAREQEYLQRANELGVVRGNKTNRRHDLHYACLGDGRELFATIDNGFFVYDAKDGRLDISVPTTRIR